MPPPGQPNKKGHRDKANGNNREQSKSQAITNTSDGERLYFATLVELDEGDYMDDQTVTTAYSAYTTATTTIGPLRWATNSAEL